MAELTFVDFRMLAAQTCRVLKMFVRRYRRSLLTTIVSFCIRCVTMWSWFHAFITPAFCGSSFLSIVVLLEYKVTTPTHVEGTQWRIQEFQNGAVPAR